MYTLHEVDIGRLFELWDANMEAVLSALTVGLFVLVAYKICSFLLEYYQMCKKLRKIPQLPAHWLLGNTDKMHDSVTYIDTIKQWVNKEGIRMYCIWIGPFPVVGTTHPETVKQVMKQENSKAKGQIDGYRHIFPWIGDGLLLSDGKKWERNRKLLTPAFHFDILKGYVLSMNTASNIFLNKLEQATEGGKSIDILQYTCKLALDVMLRCSLSYEGADKIQHEEDVQYIKAVRRLSEMLWIRLVQPRYLLDWMFNLSSMGREYKKLIDYVHNFTGNIIQSRREKLASKGNDVTPTVERRHLDFLDILLTAKDEEGKGLTDQEIQDEVDTFTFEGHDTTASAIGWTIYALGKYPELQQKVYEDVCNVLEDRTTVELEDISRFEYLPLFIKEVMRMYTTVPIIARKHSSPITIDGVEIPPGPRIDINLHVLHQNVKGWKNPEVFDPERFSAQTNTELYGFLPFSAGSRNCIGQNFALNEIKITIAKFVKRYTVSVEGLEEPVLLPEVVFKSSNGLQVKLTSRL